MRSAASSPINSQHDDTVYSTSNAVVGKVGEQENVPEWIGVAAATPVIITGTPTITVMVGVPTTVVKLVSVLNVVSDGHRDGWEGTAQARGAALAEASTQERAT